MFDNYVKIAKKFLKSENFDFNGYVYTFDEVTRHKEFDDTFRFKITAHLPKPGQSYSAQKMSEDINKIVENLFNFLGKRFSYSTYLELDTEKEGSPSVDVYVTPEKRAVILSELNKNFSKLEFPFPAVNGNLIFEIYYFDSETFERQMFGGDGGEEEISCYLYFKVSDIKLMKNDIIEDIEPKKSSIQELGDVFLSKFYESRYHGEIENLIYIILEDEMRIQDSEVYYTAKLNLKFIEGVEVKPQWTGSEFKPYMFVI